MSSREVTRLRVLDGIRRGGRSQGDAAQLLDLSDRGVRALLGRLESRGPAGLLHGNRACPSKGRIPDPARERIVRLYRDRYESFRLTHFREMLLKPGRLKASCREILRRILHEAGAWQARRRDPKHRLRQPRRDHKGNCCS